MDDQIRDILRRLIERYSDNVESDDDAVDRLINQLYETYGDTLEQVVEDGNAEWLVVIAEPKDSFLNVPQWAIDLREEIQPQIAVDVRKADFEIVSEQALADEIRETNLSAAFNRDAVDTVASLLKEIGVDDPDGSKAASLTEQFRPQIEQLIEEMPEELAVLGTLNEDERAFIERLIPPEVSALRAELISQGELLAAEQRSVAEEIRLREVDADNQMVNDAMAARAQTLNQQGGFGGSLVNVASEAKLAAERQEIQAQIDALSGRTLPPIAEIQRLQQQLAEVGQTPAAGPGVLQQAWDSVTKGTGTAEEPSSELSMEDFIQMFLDTQSSGVTYSGSGSSGSYRLSAAEEKEANEAEIKAILAEQFGGFGFFLQDNLSSLYVGLTADGTIVDHADPSAVTVKNVLDVIVDKGIVDPTRVLGILQKTEWWQTTDIAARKFDATWFDMSEPARAESLEPITLALDDEAQFLGFELAPDRAFELAKQIAREGKTQDVDYIRRLMVAESAFDAVGTEISAFGAARDQLQQMASQYFVPIDDGAAAAFAEEIYTGERAAEEMEQYFKLQATARFPTLDKAINELGITPEQYFSPYKYQIEQMLDRPNVDILNDFAEIIEYIPEGAGGSEPRPMTLAEMRTFVRGTDEWQASTQGQDQAQALAHAIGRTFGEVG